MWAQLCEFLSFIFFCFSPFVVVAAAAVKGLLGKLLEHVHSFRTALKYSAGR